MVVDLGSMPHLLIAGATGSGKSVCIISVIACLLYDNTPDELKLLLIDPKRVELTNFNGIPHLLAPVIVEVDEVVGALRWITREMDRRYKLFSDAGKRNLNTYNRAMAARKDGHKLPHIIVIIDELADLMLTSPEEIERSVCRIAQMARATGIHLVMATQRPSVDVVTGLIKANFPARISFAVTTLIDSRVVLDSPGAEKLLGRGDMLFMTPDSSKLTRLQGCFVSDAELDRLAKFWRRSVTTPSVEPEEAPWQEESFLESENATDELLAEAIELVQEQGKASTSWLQRQFRIGYPRAARLMDDLEKMGIVGPPEKGGRGRQVLSRDSSSDENPDASHDPEPQ
jgi:S-DNA-T family DNA segregation ATPase FtsK/SpoIIIE